MIDTMPEKEYDELMRWWDKLLNSDNSVGTTITSSLEPKKTKQPKTPTKPTKPKQPKKS